MYMIKCCLTAFLKRSVVAFARFKEENNFDNNMDSAKKVTACFNLPT